MRSAFPAFRKLNFLLDGYVMIDTRFRVCRLEDGLRSVVLCCQGFVVHSFAVLSGSTFDHPLFRGCFETYAHLIEQFRSLSCIAYLLTSLKLNECYLSNAASRFLSLQGLFCLALANGTSVTSECESSLSRPPQPDQHQLSSLLSAYFPQAAGPT